MPIAITYGYSRDHREDLKQWMLALATTHDGDVPIFLRPLDGNSSDKEHLSAAVREVMRQLREQVPEEQEQCMAVFDSGGYSEANMKSYNDANIWWISRVPETSAAAKTALEEVEEQWHPLSDGSGDYMLRTVELPQGKERWVIVRTHAQVLATQEQMEKQVKKTQQEWEKRLSHEQVISTYKEQGGVERGFRFLKDPVFLASSVFVKKPERVIALSFVMVLCLLVYRLAEHLLRRRLVDTEQTLPNQINKPTNRPTMRWIFQCFEGIDLLYIRIGSHWHTQVLGLQALHQQVLRLLGPVYSQFYFFSP